MTVKELKELLEKYPDDMEVYGTYYDREYGEWDHVLFDECIVTKFSEDKTVLVLA